MMVIVPTQLQNPSFKFFLIIKESKLPQEKKWNSDNSYHFFDPKLINHKGNYGICTGYGNLVVIDFDDRDYYNLMADKLPPTFTVVSAGKRLPHLYYILKDEMFRKIAILNHEKKTLADIQAERNGVVCPGSVINRRYYTVINNRPLTEITTEQIKTIFNIVPKQKRVYDSPMINCPAKIRSTIKQLVNLGIKRTSEKSFQCPFHPMTGKGNLTVFGDGCLYCFHENKYWRNVEEFMIDKNEFNKS